MKEFIDLISSDIFFDGFIAGFVFCMISDVFHALASWLLELAYERHYKNREFRKARRERNG